MLALTLGLDSNAVRPGKKGPAGQAAERAQGALLGCARWDVTAARASLWLGWTDTGMAYALWREPTEPRPTELMDIPELPVPARYADVLSAYFAGTRIDPASLPVDLPGTAFQIAVWQALRAVPLGRVRSYAGIALDVKRPRAMRAVGRANSRNPVAVIVPCHRVVEKDMRIGGYTSGLPLKRFLLELEGVSVVGDVVQPGQLTLI
jgi:methylated-DNA-[protein]-cysteine S-methyltransferase